MGTTSSGSVSLSPRRCVCYGSRLWAALCLTVPVAILWIADLGWLLPRNLRTSSTTHLLKNETLIHDFLEEDLLLLPECQGKEKLLMILHRAGKHELTLTDCEMLPTWQEVADLYGDKPIIHGLETCQAYRDKLQGRDPDPRVAGLFNTGTNALAESLQLNFQYKDTHDYNLPNGKHTQLANKPWLDRVTNTSCDALEFPITLIRDPFRWMISMCKSSYKARWMRGVDGHCPNLVPNLEEQHLKYYQDVATFQVRLRRNYTEQYDSLADMWSEWYRQYVDADFPGLVIRFEDTLFHAELVMATILECIGRPLQGEFKYHLDPSKPHGNPADFVSALSKYGRAEGRDAGLSPEDRIYVQTALDHELMSEFHYPQIPIEEPKSIPATSAADAADGRPAMSESETHDKVADLAFRYTECEGKEELLAILSRARESDLSVEDCQMLPTWDEVRSLYGDELIIVGLDTCEEYRSRLQANGLQPDPRVAGLFNTGTNAFAESLMLNYEMKDILEYTAPGGKHTNIKNKVVDTNRTVGVLPIVLIRDPYRWMISQCKSPYKAHWIRGEPGHCPNLVPDENELAMAKYHGITTFQVSVVDRDYDETYDSLADMWSDYYEGYMNAAIPRLVIRFEDTLFHAEKVMELVSECVGMPMKAPFRYQWDASKEHGNPADFVTALAKYGRAGGREGGMTELDKEYAAMALDSDLMQTFHYPYLPSVGHANAPKVVDIDAAVEHLVNNHPECHGKEKLLEIFVKAGVAELLDEEELLCDELPTWAEVVSLYGNEPVIYGLESCPRYRDKIAAARMAGRHVKPDPRVGGLFNTGTNALADLFILNYEAKDKLAYNAPGGKHTRLSQKWWEPYARTTNGTFEFPIILIRDPYRFMNSMCKTSYKADWMPGAAGHCPNLIPSSEERRRAKYKAIETYEVDVDHPIAEHYKSLADMWSDWYKEWVKTPIPSLIIRFEDMLFHADTVMQTILECIGESLEEPFIYQLEAAKDHGSPADFFTALAKYGRAAGREGGMLMEDKQYARTALDPMLLQLFHYKHVPLNDVDVEVAY